jgi:hypothetical protein
VYSVESNTVVLRDDLLGRNCSKIDVKQAIDAILTRNSNSPSLCEDIEGQSLNQFSAHTFCTPMKIPTVNINQVDVKEEEFNDDKSAISSISMTCYNEKMSDNISGMLIDS